MKKILSLVLALVMVLGVCALASADDWKFERKIEIVCPWGLGGGADSTIRPMATLLQNNLGVPVEVRNETGGSGVTGATYAFKQPADGYTFLLGTQS
ncbi:MAG: tripartite tricarboxylate transporter substrate binding protein, partial [Clostridia bacterium]|nr:tripartite tricarboxylate transporter substrate binding protein [Clostridia bacterium]